MSQPKEYRLNDCTISLDNGCVVLEWDHGDMIVVTDAGGFLVVDVNDEEVLSGEYHEPRNG